MESRDERNILRQRVLGIRDLCCYVATPAPMSLNKRRIKAELRLYPTQSQEALFRPALDMRGAGTRE